jgi:hypothetical protein
MMDQTSVLNKTDLPDDKIADTISYKKQLFIEQAGINPVIDNLIAEGGEHFVHYLHWLGLEQEANLVVLPSRHHYYYDINDLKGVTVLVNMKKLNLIKHLDSFLHVVFRVLPPDATFIGCFSDSKKQKINGTAFYQPSRIYSRFINFLDSKTDKDMSKNEVMELLDSHGFKIVGMAEINGLTYFTTRNQRNSGE